MLSVGAKITVLGLTCGLVTSALIAGWMRGLLFEVSVRDPSVYATAAGFVLVVAITACALPARRAMRADPTMALRQE
jgi:ABC-type antimicrobial peptide transport system permease subunit